MHLLKIMASLLVSFLFGLLGYLISLCMSTTLAGYYGAMTGLGLSCIKVGVLYAVSAILIVFGPSCGLILVVQGPGVLWRPD